MELTSKVLNFEIVFLYDRVLKGIARKLYSIKGVD